MKIATVRRLLPQLRAISSSSFGAIYKHHNLTPFVGAIQGKLLQKERDVRNFKLLLSPLNIATLK